MYYLLLNPSKIFLGSVHLISIGEITFETIFFHIHIQTDLIFPYFVCMLINEIIEANIFQPPLPPSLSTDNYFFKES